MTDWNIAASDPIADIQRAIAGFWRDPQVVPTMALSAGNYTYFGRLERGHCPRCGYRKKPRHVCPRSSEKSMRRRLARDTGVHVRDLPVVTYSQDHESLEVML